MIGAVYKTIWVLQTISSKDGLCTEQRKYFQVLLIKKVVHCSQLPNNNLDNEQDTTQKHEFNISQ